MSDFSHIFSGIQNAKPVSSFTPRLPVGRHIVAIKKYGGKQSQSAMGVILELDCVVMQTTNPQLKVGESRGWAWFPGQSGWGGQYEQGRAKEFIEQAGSGAGDARDVTSVGDSLTKGEYTGVLIAVDITQQFERDGATPKRDKKGNPTFNATWSAVPGQDANSVQASRTQMSAYAAAEPAAPAQSPAQQTQAAFAAPTAAPVAVATQQVAPAFDGFATTAPTQQAPAAAPAANPLAGLLGGLKK